MLLYDIIEKQEELTHEYLVCIDSLTNLFDKDIENIKFIYDYLARQDKKFPILFFYSRQFKKALAEANIDKNSLILTLEKAVNLQLIRREYDIDFDLDIDVESPHSSTGQADNDEYFKKTTPGFLLYGFIKKVTN